jgi:two-component system LytT family response regulator
MKYQERGFSMKIAICDDEKIYRLDLIKKTDDYFRNIGMDAVFFEFSDGNELMDSNIDFDLIFIDHKMKNRNGLDAVTHLRARGNDTHVIFVSSYKDIVFDSMKVKAFRFLIKPVADDKLREALDSFIKETVRCPSVLVHDDSNLAVCNIKENSIIYAQAENVYTKIFTKDNAYVFRNTLSKFEEELKSSFFFRVHRSYIVNLNYIERFSKTDILLSTQEKVPISKKRYKPFREDFFEFVKKESFNKI